MKEILKLCDGFVPGSTPQVLFRIWSCWMLDLICRCSLTEIHTSFQQFWTSTGCNCDWHSPGFQGRRDARLREQLRLDSRGWNPILGSRWLPSSGLYLPRPYNIILHLNFHSVIYLLECYSNSVYIFSVQPCCMIKYYPQVVTAREDKKIEVLCALCSTRTHLRKEWGWWIDDEEKDVKRQIQRQAQ